MKVAYNCYIQSTLSEINFLPERIIYIFILAARCKIFASQQLSTFLYFSYKLSIVVFEVSEPKLKQELFSLLGWPYDIDFSHCMQF